MGCDVGGKDKKCVVEETAGGGIGRGLKTFGGAGEDVGEWASGGGFVCGCL